MYYKKILTILIVLSIVTVHKPQTLGLAQSPVLSEYVSQKIVQKDHDANLMAYPPETPKTENVVEHHLSLPSQNEVYRLNYANYSAGDAENIRVNNGQLVNSTDEEVWSIDPFNSSLHGVFCFTLSWNEEVGENIDIDLYPGWYNDDNETKGDFPSYATELEGYYYGGTNPEYYYVEVNALPDEQIKLIAYVLGYYNEVINYTLNVTWINYDDWIHDKILETPEVIIHSPYEGEKIALPVLTSNPQRNIILNYSYVPGLLGFWNESSYNMTTNFIRSTFDKENYRWGLEDFYFRIIINERNYGYTGAYNPILLGLTEVGQYNIEILCVYNYWTIYSSKNVSFEIVGYELDTASYSYSNNEVLDINQSIILPTYSENTSSLQVGTDIKEVNLHYLKNGSDVWSVKTMEKINETFYSVSLEIIPLDSPLLIFYEVVDEYNCQYMLMEYGVEINLNNAHISEMTNIDTDETTFEAPVMLLINLSSMLIALVVIRRKKVSMSKAFSEMGDDYA
ncbi:MAG: hypothetical protein ACTSYA_07915 [Candidatus Kariarchaeaceae archaeon]